MGAYDEKIISPAQSVNLVFELDDFTFWEGQKKIQMKIKDIRFNKSNNFEFVEDETQAARLEADVNAVLKGGTFAKSAVARMFDLKNIGNQYFLKKNYEKAYEFYLKALELERDPSLYYNIGLVFKCLGNYEKAVENFKQAIDVENVRTQDLMTELIKKSQVMIEKIYNLNMPGTNKSIKR